MRDAAREAADGFHFLRLPELQLQRASLGNVFHKDLEAASFFSIRNRAAGNPGHNRRPILAHALRRQVVKFFSRVKIIGGLKPLLGVGIQTSQVPAPELKGTGITKHSNHRRVRVLQDSQGVATANAVRRVHHERSKVALGESETLLRSAQSGVEPADQERDSDEESEVRDCFTIINRGLSADKRVIDADGKRERGSGETGLPASVPGAHHDGDGEDNQATLRNIGEK